MPHLIKVHGGNMYGNWANAAMALYQLQGMEARLQTAIKRANEIFEALNKLPGVKVTSTPGGTNIYNLDSSNVSFGCYRVKMFGNRSR